MTRARRQGVVLAAVLLVSVTVCACGSSDSSTPTTPTTPATPATVTSVAVSGQTPNVGLTAQFTSTATFSNGTTQNVTSQAAWQTSNTAIATVNNAGVVTAVGPGEVDVTATYQSVAGRARITVTQATFAITGVVTDATSGGILPNINLQITSGPSNGLSTKTDGGGAYTLNGVLAGATTISASAVGYVTQAKTVTVLSSNTTLDFVLVRTPGCAYTLTVTSQNAPADGGNFSFNATSGDACSWTASTSTPWITLGTTSGTGPATVTFVVAPNSTISQRTGSIRISWSSGFADYTVTQGGGVCTFALSPTTGSFTSAGGTGSFVVTPSDAACVWTATSDSSWLTVTAGASGTGVATVSYSVQSYAGPIGPRVGSILVNGTVSGLRGFPVQQQPPP